MPLHPLTDKIQKLLQESHCWFETFTHKPVRTSEEAANVRAGYSLQQGAKALIVKTKQANGQEQFAMLVLPGDLRLDNKKVKSVLSAKDTRFATPEEISSLTEGVVPGGVPPFGNLFGIKVIVDPKLFDNEKIVFNAGDRGFSIAMKASDYQRLVAPQIVSLT